MQKCFLLFTAAAVASAALVEAASAQAPPREQKIWDWTPDLSPDGRYVVFQSDRDGAQDDLLIWDVEARELRPLTASPGHHEKFPTWSSDGEWIAFQRSETGEFWDIYKIRPDGTDLTPVIATPANALNPDFSPDGRRIAYVAKVDGKMQVHVANADGSHARALTVGSSMWNTAEDYNYAHLPNWSPDGKTIAYATGSTANDTAHLWTVDVETGETKPLLIIPGVKTMGPSYSPSGNRIAFSYGVGTSFRYRLGLIDPDGENFRRLEAAAEFHTQPAWSADEKTLTYHEVIHGGYLIARIELVSEAIANFGMPGGWEERLVRRLNAPYQRAAN
ncbi:MAG: hypothetical protein Tsb0010_04280 [Parvularculaceae bacterium]